MATKVTIPYKGKTYTLEFNRRVASAMEKQGFQLDELKAKPTTMIPMLFHGAFMMHHSGVKGETKEAIYDGLRKRVALVQQLAEMYAETCNSLFDGEEEDDEGNAGWGVME